MKIKYVKIKARVAGGSTICRFARQLSEKTFLLIDRQGLHNNEYYIGMKSDIFWIKPAEMNRKYGWLEVKGENK